MPTAHPEKIYVELTTRCNLRCPMCLKFAEGSCITEGDMDLALFERLLPSLGTVRTLVLNGLGEPLLHPELETMVALARTALPADGTIGFQSNGLLLDRGRAERLLAARICGVQLSAVGNGVHPLYTIKKDNAGISRFPCALNQHIP